MGGFEQTPGSRKVLLRIGDELKNRKFHANIGAHNGHITGDIVKSGAYCYLFGWKADPDQQRHNLPPNATLVDCLSMAQSAKAALPLLRDIPSDELAKSMRTTMMVSRSRAAIFFPGGQGTNALLDAFITANTKGREAKHIALVGWSNISVQALATHMGVARLLREETWLRTFNLSSGNVDKLIDFLFANS